MAQHDREIKFMMWKLTEAYEANGCRKIHNKTTKYLVIGRCTRDLYIQWDTIKECNEYEYLGCII